MDGQTSAPTLNGFKMSPDSTESSAISSLSCAETNDQILVLESPVNSGASLKFPFGPVNTEFVDILKLAMEEFDTIRAIINKSITISLDELYRSDFETLTKVCAAFNKAAPTVRSLMKGTSQQGENADLASQKFLQQIITHCYNKAVDNEKALNKHYEPFSSCTYGETSFNRMQMIIDEIKPTNHDVFIDLGSGVGQLVAHIAGGSRVKRAFGIEIAKLPARFAAALEEEFRKLMRFYGKKIRNFSLELGDFLDPKYRTLITKESTIIFINNFAFTPELEARIKYELLLELQTGTKIISTKPYAPLNKNMNDRQMSDLAAIVDVTELKRCPNPCSWTSNDVPYYLHVVDHGKLEKYFSNPKPPLILRFRDGQRSVTPSSSKNSNSRESSVGFNDSQNVKRQKVYGPTTRKSWQAQISQNDDLPSEEGTLLSKPAPAYLSNDSDSEPERKRKKARKVTKERSKTKRVKTTEKDLDLLGTTDGKLSEDARDGIEMMHQITQAVSAGQTFDNPARILSDLASKKLPKNGQSSSATVKKRSTINGCKQTDAMFPLSDVIQDSTPTGKNKKRMLPNIDPNIYAPSKYPHLEVFLSELRRTYEIFLDNIQTPSKYLTTINAQNKDIGIQPKSQWRDTTAGPISNIDIIQMVDRISQKQADLHSDITNFRRILLLKLQYEAETQSASVNTQSSSNNIPGLVEPIHPRPLDAASNYQNLTSNGNYLSLLNTQISNLLSAKYLSPQALNNLNQLTAAAIQSASAHISPQQPMSTYSSQLSTPVTHQWDQDVINQLKNIVSSTNYSAMEKNEFIYNTFQENPIFANMVNSILNNGLANQVQQINSLGYNTASTSNDIQSAFSAVKSEAPSIVSTTSASSLIQQNELIPNQKFSPNDLVKPETKPKSKKATTERKPRANAKRPKDQTDVPLGSSSTYNQTANTEPSTSKSQNFYANGFGHQSIAPQGVENILHQTLSIQSQLTLPKEQPPASFHSPAF